jgi:hypothetical protein
VIWAHNFVMLMLGRLMTGVVGDAFCVSLKKRFAVSSELSFRF